MRMRKVGIQDGVRCSSIKQRAADERVYIKSLLYQWNIRQRMNGDPSNIFQDIVVIIFLSFVTEISHRVADLSGAFVSDYFRTQNGSSPRYKTSGRSIITGPYDM